MPKPLLDLLIELDQVMGKINGDLDTCSMDLLHDKAFLVRRNIERWKNVLETTVGLRSRAVLNPQKSILDKNS